MSPEPHENTAREEFQKDPEVVLAAIRGPKGDWDAISAGSPEAGGFRVA